VRESCTHAARTNGAASSDCRIIERVHAIKKWGSRQVRFELDRLTDYTDEAIVAEIRRVANVVGAGRLTIAEFSKLSKVAVTTLRRRFGSWPKALEAAGLAGLCNPVAPASKSRILARSLSDDEMLDEIRRVAHVAGTSNPTADDLRQHAVVGVDAIRNRFGTLKAAFRAAGVLETAHGRRYTDEECFENLLTVWTHYGRPPQYKEMNLIPSAVGPKAYVVRWKTWNRALQAFVDRVNQETVETSVTATVPLQTTPSKAARPESLEEDQHKIKLGLRYKVLTRDKFKCVLCGSSPATNPTCCLHVDHITPWSKGGKTVLQNLRSLCDRCNLGKGDQIEP
jgi:5-methylcytosine-specific restriction endonuclease McrA